jgi:hypothetical protein
MHETSILYPAVINVPAPWSENLGLNYRPAARLPRLKFFLIVFCSYSQIPQYFLKF